MKEKLSLIYGLLWRVAWLFIPIFSENASARANSASMSNEGIRLIVSIYSDAIIIIACIVLSIAGSVVGYFFPIPKYGPEPMPKPVKLLLSMIGGMLAFVYYIHTQQLITPAVIIWVFGVSFVFPAIAHLLHAAAIKFTGSRANISAEELKQIAESFQKKDQDPQERRNNHDE